MFPEYLQCIDPVRKTSVFLQRAVKEGGFGFWERSAVLGSQHQVFGLGDLVGRSSWWMKLVNKNVNNPQISYLSVTDKQGGPPPYSSMCQSVEFLWCGFSEEASSFTK